MTESMPVEGSKVYFLVEETASMLSTANFLQRRNVHVELFSDIKDFFIACTDQRPEFVAISVNHHNPKVSELIEKIGSHLACEVIVFAEKPDRRSLPLIRRVQFAHKLMGAMSGPSLLLKMRKILRKDRKEPKSFVLEVVESSTPQTDEHFLISEGKAHGDFSYSTDVRKRGTGPSILQKSPATDKDSLIWEKAEPKKKSPLYFFDSAPPGPGQRKSEPELGPLPPKLQGAKLDVQVFDNTYKEVAQWIEKGLRETVLEGNPQVLTPFPENTHRIAIVQVKDAKKGGYVLLACSEDQQLEGDLLSDLLKNLKDLRSSPDGPQWNSFKLLDVDIKDIQGWVAGVAQAKFLSQHATSELLASFVASDKEIPKLNETLKGHLNIPVSQLPADTPLDYDTFLHLYLNDKLLPYVSRGGSLSQRQLLKLAQVKGHPLLIKEKDRSLFEAQYLKENILSLKPQPSSKKKAS